MVWNKSQRRLKNLPTDVYRIYDQEGRLLYVGASINVFSRLREHRMYAEWWPLAFEGTVNRYENRAMARAVEAHAIRNERPVYNITDERAEAIKRITITDPIEVIELWWDEGKVWIDASD